MKKFILFIMASFLFLAGAEAQSRQLFSGWKVEALESLKLKEVTLTSFKKDSALSQTDSVSVPTSMAVAKFVAGKINGVTTTTFADTSNIDFAKQPFQTITLTDTVVFSSSNYAAGKELYLRIVPGASNRIVSFPSGWKWVGAAAPTSVAANKTALLRLVSFGTAAADVVARYEVEQ